jgi:hypothetical protein
MSHQPSRLAQLSFFINDEPAPPQTSSTFLGNLNLPIHRWFRYSAGFSAIWVAETIKAAMHSQLAPVRILDPFAGSGTVLIEAEAAGVESKGVESHPFVARIAKVKTCREIDPEGFLAYAQAILKRAGQINPLVQPYPILIRKCYPDDLLGELDQLRSAWLETVGSSYHDHGWLTLAAILRQCSPVGTANWQYVLPKKTKTKVTAPFTAFKAKAMQIYADMKGRPRNTHAGMLLQGDAREINGIADGWATLVVTSPPLSE